MIVALVVEPAFENGPNLKPGLLLLKEAVFAVVAGQHGERR